MSQPAGHKRHSGTEAKKAAAFQDLALLGERSDLSTEAAQLLALVAAQAVAATLVDVDLTGPVTQRLRRDSELASEHGHRLAAALEQLDRLAAELQRYGKA